MRIDNSAANMFRECPDKYKERYREQLERKPLGPTGLSFGTRMHQLLAKHYGKVSEQQLLLGVEQEFEAQELLEAYKAHYPQEPFEVVEVERQFEVPLGPEVECDCGVHEVVGQAILQSTPYGLKTVQPTRKVYQQDCQKCKGLGKHAKHTYIGKWDAIIRMRETGKLKIFETKTEKRNGKANTPTSWASRDQGSLYLYAGENILGEPFDGVLLNILTKGSEKGEKPPTFRRDSIERTESQIRNAIRDIAQTADDIEAAQKRYASGEPWLQHRENCTNKTTGWNCDYFSLHTYGRSQELIEIEYQKPKPYLEEPPQEAVCAIGL